MAYVPGSGGGGQPGNKNAEKWSEEKALKVADDLIEWLKEPIEYEYLGQNSNTRVIKKANLYFKYFLAQEGFYDELIDHLSEKYKSFSKKIKKAKSIQEGKIAELSMSGMINPTMSIFMLKNHHGYSDKQDLTHKFEDAKNFEFW